MCTLFSLLFIRSLVLIHFTKDLKLVEEVSVLDSEALHSARNIDMVKIRGGVGCAAHISCWPY